MPYRHHRIMLAGTSPPHDQREGRSVHRPSTCCTKTQGYPSTAPATLRPAVHPFLRSADPTGDSSSRHSRMQTGIELRPRERSVYDSPPKMLRFCHQPRGRPNSSPPTITTPILTSTDSKSHHPIATEVDATASWGQSAAVTASESLDTCLACHLSLPLRCDGSPRRSLTNAVAVRRWVLPFRVTERVSESVSLCPAATCGLRKQITHVADFQPRFWVILSGDIFRVSVFRFWEFEDG